MVLLSVLLCSSLSLVQGYFWIYDEESETCEIRLVDVWSAWTWASEMTIFLLIPLIILFFNVLVILEVKKKAAADANRMRSCKQDHRTKSSDFVQPNYSSHMHTNQGFSSAASTLMLLSVSFYVIVTTLPATLFYALYEQFPMGDPNMTDDEIKRDPKWQRHSSYLLSRKIAEEICLSHYACNFFLYILTGKQFRRTMTLMWGKCGNLFKSTTEWNQCNYSATAANH